MNKKFQRIWEIALPYQDKRDDDGHAKIVTESANEILKSENGDEDVVIPAAILHDIGWSQISTEERMSLFETMPGSAKDKELRIKHQVEGVKLGRTILEKVNYDKHLAKEILEIISEHDTRKTILNQNDAIMRDADKLWMFSEKGFQADLVRRKISADEWSKYLISVIDNLHTKSAQTIAKRELNLRIGNLK